MWCITAQTHETTSALNAAGSLHLHVLNLKESMKKKSVLLKKDPVFTHHANLHQCSVSEPVTTAALVIKAFQHKVSALDFNGGWEIVVSGESEVVLPQLSFSLQTLQSKWFIWTAWVWFKFDPKLPPWSSLCVVKVPRSVSPWPFVNYSAPPKTKLFSLCHGRKLLASFTAVFELWCDSLFLFVYMTSSTL